MSVRKRSRNGEPVNGKTEQNHNVNTFYYIHSKARDFLLVVLYILQPPPPPPPPPTVIFGESRKKNQFLKLIFVILSADSK